MFTEEEIKTVVTSKIESEEKLGDQSGGSGHSGCVSYLLTEVHAKERNDGRTEISYRYKILVENEFTIYPDNPPMESLRKKTIVIDKGKNIVSEHENE